MRFFAAANDGVYEQARLTLDAAWGLPNGRGTDTCIPTVNAAPRDEAGRPMVAVSEEWCEWEPANTLLPQLIGSGAVEEVGSEVYAAAIAGPLPLSE